MEREDGKERAVQIFGTALEQIRLEAVQTKLASLEMASEVEALAMALANNQAEMALHMEEEMAKLEDGICNEIYTIAREFSDLGKAVDSEQQKRRVTTEKLETDR